MITLGDRVLLYVFNYPETDGLYGAYIAEFTRVIIPLSFFPAFRGLIGLTFYSTMRLRGLFIFTFNGGVERLHGCVPI